MNANDMLKRLSLQAPYLMIDKITELVPGRHLKALKLLSANEIFFPAHFPGYPVMPGVLMIEVFSQAIALLSLGSLPTTEVSYIPVFCTCETARFRRPVMIGDVLSIHVTVLKNKGRFLKTRVVASVEDTTAADAVMLTTLAQKSPGLPAPAHRFLS